jgi:general secretion pathway protein K
MQQQRGAALLLVLMLLAIMAALAAQMTLSFQSQLERTMRVNRQYQRQFDRELAENLAVANLLKDMQDNDQQSSANQFWAQPQTRVLKETGNRISWRLRDAQHCFNINALAQTPRESLTTSPYPLLVFAALLKRLGIDGAKSDEIAQAVADYIDSDNSARLHGAEDDYYLSQKPTRRSADQRLYLISELLNIKGMNSSIFHQILPFICALPTTELAININALSENEVPLLMALFLNNITQADALTLIRKQPSEGWKNPGAFLYRAEQESVAVKPLSSRVQKILVSSSRFFRLDIRSESQGDVQQWRSLIYYRPDQRSAHIYQRNRLLSRTE